MSGDEDHFRDWNHEEQGLGSLQGDFVAPRGAKIPEKLKPQGLALQMDCCACYAPYELVLDYESLTWCGENGPGVSISLPPDWKYSQANADMYFCGMCTRCGGGDKREPTVCPHLTPDECRKHVKAALSAGFISPQQVQAVQRMVAARRGGGR